MRNGIMKLRRIFGARIVVIIFLLAGMTLAAPAQEADIQPTFFPQQLVMLDQAMDDAVTWLRTHIAVETMTALFSFSAPTADLSRYVADRLITGMRTLGIGSVIQVDGDIIDTDVLNISGSIGGQTIVVGAITLSGRTCQLAIRSLHGKTGAFLGQYTASMPIDQTISALLGSPPAQTYSAPSALDDKTAQAVQAAQAAQAALAWATIAADLQAAIASQTAPVQGSQAGIPNSGTPGPPPPAVPGFPNESPAVPGLPILGSRPSPILGSLTGLRLLLGL
jgi:hypothetical protein